MFSFFVTHTSKCFLVKEACSCNWDFRFFTTQKKTAIVWSKEFKKTIKSTMIGWEIRIDSSREKHKDCNHWMDMSGPKLQERGKKKTHCWFAGDVTAAMLVVKNKSISLLWELNSIFMQMLREKKFYRIDPQHGRLVTWLQTKNKDHLPPRPGLRRTINPQ